MPKTSPRRPPQRAGPQPRREPATAHAADVGRDVPPAVSALRPLNWAWGASTSCQQHGAAREETAAVARLSSPTPAPVHGGEL